MSGSATAARPDQQPSRRPLEPAPAIPRPEPMALSRAHLSIAHTSTTSQSAFRAEPSPQRRSRVACPRRVADANHAPCVRALAASTPALRVALCARAPLMHTPILLLRHPRHPRAHARAARLAPSLLGAHAPSSSHCVVVPCSHRLLFSLVFPHHASSFTLLTPHRSTPQRYTLPLPATAHHCALLSYFFLSRCAPTVCAASFPRVRSASAGRRPVRTPPAPFFAHNIASTSASCACSPRRRRRIGDWRVEPWLCATMLRLKSHPTALPGGSPSFPPHG